MGSEVVIVPSLFLVIGYVFYVMAAAFTRRQQLRSTTEFQTKLLERMGTIGEFGQFLNTEGGQRFLGALATEPMAGLPQQRVIRAFQSGIVMICLGIGIFMYLSSVRLESEAYESVGFVGTVSAAVGIGLLLSGWASLKLSQRMGLINGKPHAPVVPDVARTV
jgi:TRAP-type mannitol/chloroaromatic compound transport system permease large subunit